MTSRGSKLRGIALVVGVGLVLAGCEKATDGVPTGTGASSASSSVKPSGSKDPDTAIWDPCTALPDDALRADELNPDTRTKDIARFDPTGWKVCAWRSTAKWYDLGIYSGEPSLQQVRQRQDLESVVPLTVGGHPALRFLFADDAEKRLDCGVAVEVPQGRAAGTVAFLVTTRYSVGKLGDPCDQATRHANDFAKYLPGGGN
ncbi:DUF3558 domain-containing protein [Nocardia sp. NPDC006044]|uniref:DUF3558 domain-containing protein n=1 Tax=Nocardia sp. NPDC006044 TaxID=3364306 RepID=UPI00368C4225